MNVDFFGLIYLVGAIQGVFFIISLFFTSNFPRQTKYFLASIVFVLIYDAFETFLWYQNVRFITTHIFPYTLLFTLGANMYLVFKTSIYPEKVRAKEIAFLYFPAIIDGIVRLFIYTSKFTLNLSNDEFNSLNQSELILSRLLMIAVFWGYFILTFREFKNINKDVKTDKTEIGVSKKWLMIFLCCIFFIALVWTVFTVGIVISNQPNSISLHYPLGILVTILLYLIGFAAYYHFGIISSKNSRKNPQVEGKLSDEEINETLTKLSKAMSVEKLYLDPELTLYKLSTHINLSPRTISSVLNHHLNISFNEYVNDFRVEEVKRNLLLPESRKLTIIAIAFESGFNSIPTFQRVFKNITGLTPKQFLNQNLERSAK
jgi:AraC-like DNA-binding protein